jgi:hypothetical protein
MEQRMSAFDHYERALVLKQVHMFYPAIEDFRKAARDPHYAGKAHVQIALCLRATGRHDEAVMAFRQALASGTLSAEEQRHILYHMGQTLESLGRYAESLEVYGWIRKEDPGFRDVTQRIKHLSAGGRGPVPSFQGSLPAWMDGMRARGRQLKPQMVSFLEQTGQWLRRQTEGLTSDRLRERTRVGTKAAARSSARQPEVTKPGSQPAMRKRAEENRRHPRVPVRLRSHFSTKGRMLTGEGQLRDLSPWGCRITSAVAVPVGEDVECCIFPQDAGHPFVIDGATVRWINSTEFGLAFTNVRPNVQRRLAQLCRTKAA